MRVLLNDREIPGLDARLERRLAGRPSDRAVEGVAISAGESVRLRRRQLTWLIAAVLAFVIATQGGALAIVAARRPEVLGLLLLVFGGTAFLAAGLCWLVVGLMIRAHARRIEARAAAMTLAPGVIVRVDPTGVSVDGRAWAWSSLRIDELGVRERQGNDTRITYVERLALSNGQRRLNLDALFLTNGRALLQQIWRRSRGTPA